MLDQYPTLKKVVELLSRTDEPPALSRDLDPINEKRGETVIGELTIGERHLHAHNHQEVAALRAIGEEIDRRGSTEEEDKRLVACNRMMAIFWDSVNERLGSKENISIREGFKVVSRIHDCGCGKGHDCGLVQAGVINPETGEHSENNPLALLFGGGLEEEESVHMI